MEGLENLSELMELVLDRNKIKQVGEFSFVSQRKLEELHVEENRLRSLANMQCLDALKRLYAGNNRIQVRLTENELCSERGVHHCSGPPVSEMTYTVSSGTLNPSIPYHTIQVGLTAS